MKVTKYIELSENENYQRRIVWNFDLLLNSLDPCEMLRASKENLFDDFDGNEYVEVKIVFENVTNSCLSIGSNPKYDGYSFTNRKKHLWKRGFKLRKEVF